MCDPLTASVLTTALAVGSSVSEHVATNQFAAANRDAANLNFAREQDAISREQVLIDRQDSENAFDTAIAAARAQGQIVASASDRGVAGQGVAQALNASLFGIGRQATLEDINLRTQRQNLATRRDDAEISRQNQIRSVPRSSLLQLGLALAGDTAQGYSSFKTAQDAGRGRKG